jgi:hypothetical protein
MDGAAILSMAFGCFVAKIVTVQQICSGVGLDLKSWEGLEVPSLIPRWFEGH